MSKIKNKKKRLIIILGILFIGAMVTISIISRNSNKPVEVEPLNVELQDFKKEVSANGEITSKKNTRIFAAVAAAVDEVFVDEGSTVEKDEIIITLDRENLENNLINAENAVANARMMVRSELLNLRTAYSAAVTAEAQARRDMERASELHKIGSVSDEELRIKQETLYIAEGNLDSARQKLNFREGRPLDDQRSGNFRNDSEIVEASPEVTKALSDYDISLKNLKNYEIKAEIGGTITILNIDENSVTEPGKMLAEIHDQQQLIVKAMIDEVDLSYITIGQDVRITSDSFIDTDLAGKVSKIAPVITMVNDSRVCAIEVDLLENPGRIARIGAGASIYIIVEERFQVPAIPVEAYFVEDNSKWVWRLEPSAGQDEENAQYFMPVKQKIETGILGIEHIEVSEGLGEDDLIISGRIPGIEENIEVVRKKDSKKGGE